MSTKPKKILFEDSARLKLLSGIKKLTDTISVTLGPSGKNVAIGSLIGYPKIKKDGTGITDEIELKDPFEDMGASLAKDLASKIDGESGDGTKTSLLLLYSLIREGVKNISAGANTVNIKNGLKNGLKIVLEEIEKSSFPIKKDEEIENIATISASGDREVGKFIKDGFKMVKRSGVITIEESKKTQTSIELVEGMRYKGGYLSPYFSPDGKNLEISDPLILVTDKKLSSVHDILPLLQTVATSGRELVIIADEVEKDLLSTLVVNRLKQTLKAVAVHAPAFGERRKAMLEDIAILTGSKYISEDKGESLKNISTDDLGSCKKIVISKDNTTIIGGAGDKGLIKNRTDQIEESIQYQDNEYEKEKLGERISKLKGGVALIKVGALVEAELKRKKKLFETSLNATRQAIASGVTVGGGVALFRAANSLPSKDIGMNILKKACEEPIRKIIENSGKNPGIILEKIEKKGKLFGFNATTKNIEDLSKSGIFDPTETVKNALSYAVSTATVLLSTEALISE